MSNVLTVLILVALGIIILLMIRQQNLATSNEIDVTDATNLPKIDCSQITGQQYKGTLKIPGVGEVYCDGLMTCNNGKITCSPQTITTPIYYRYPVYILRSRGRVHHGGHGNRNGNGNGNGNGGNGGGM